jgi:GNAT superfamily N-acetyltransferase
MSDRTPWCDLYRQYAHFYQSPMTDAILDRSWSWLMDPRHPMEGLVAESEERHLLGLAHFRACPDPLIAQDVGFLDDLFVAQDQRGSGIGRSLIMGVAAKAQERAGPWCAGLPLAAMPRRASSTTSLRRRPTGSLTTSMCSDSEHIRRSGRA